MDPIDIEPMIEELEENIDDLEAALAPLLRGALSDTMNKLPVLDRAQLYVTATWSIESILFSYLRLNNISAKEHPVFRELTRVKQYFDKIKSVEVGDSPRPNTLDKPAVGRFIKHGLAGNEAYDRKRAQQQAGEKARAHIKFEEISHKRKRDDVEEPGLDSNGKVAGDSRTSNEQAVAPISAEPVSNATSSSGEDLDIYLSSEEKPGLVRKKKGYRRKRSKGTKDASLPGLKASNGSTLESLPPEPVPRKRLKKSRAERRAAKAAKEQQQP